MDGGTGGFQRGEPGPKIDILGLQLGQAFAQRLNGPDDLGLGQAGRDVLWGQFQSNASRRNSMARSTLAR